MPWRKIKSGKRLEGRLRWRCGSFLCKGARPVFTQRKRNSSRGNFNCKIPDQETCLMCSRSSQNEWNKLTWRESGKDKIREALGPRGKPFIGRSKDLEFLLIKWGAILCVEQRGDMSWLPCFCCCVKNKLGRARWTEKDRLGSPCNNPEGTGWLFRCKGSKCPEMVTF